jgi:hypothetical protein
MISLHRRKTVSQDYSGEYANRFIVYGVRAGIYYKNYFFTYENRGAGKLFSFWGGISRIFIYSI